MKRTILAMATAMAALSPGMSIHAAHAADAAASAVRAEVAQGRGTIVRVDAGNDIVNIRHEAIAALKWPAMAMDFKVGDNRLLAGLKPGQTVVFGLVRDPLAGYRIGRIEVVR